MTTIVHAPACSTNMTLLDLIFGESPLPLTCFLSSDQAIEAALAPFPYPDNLDDVDVWEEQCVTLDDACLYRSKNVMKHVSTATVARYLV